MPKSRGRKKKPKGTVLKIGPEAMDVLHRQRERFREKFGRDPGPHDPVFFDEDADVPTPMSTVRVQAESIEALREAGAPAEVVYAYKKTGLLSLGDTSQWPKDRREEWKAAIAEFRLIEEARATGSPKPEGWNTEIPELLEQNST